VPITLEFTIEPEGTAKQVRIDDLVIAGWTGRNVDALEKHIVELEELGVPRPSSVPCFYRVGAENFCNGEDLQFLGTTSSGEVEFVLIGTDEGMLIGVGSDHTDREVETYSVPVSKQMCLKPVSRSVWRYSDVADHFDDILLRGWATGNGDAPAGRTDRFVPAGRNGPALRHGDVLRHFGGHRRHPPSRAFRRRDRGSQAGPQNFLRVQREHVARRYLRKLNII
jgi:hypothetical protein